MSSTSRDASETAGRGLGAAPVGDGQVYITDRAAAMMRKQLDRRENSQAAIRLGIRGGGCTGYSYHFEFDDGPPRSTDRVFVAGTVRVYVDAKSIRLLAGTTVDFETGMRGHGFRFDNPNVKSNCGCGESITF